jgi:hypothetical protein
MGVLYELAITSATAAAGANYFEHLSNGTRRCHVREYDFFSQTAVAISLAQLGRPANTPAGGTATVASGGQQDPAEAAGTGGFITSGWSTAPTQPATTARLKQFDAAAVIGSGVIYTWPSDGEVKIGLTRNLSLTLWNAGAATGPPLSASSVWAE